MPGPLRLIRHLNPVWKLCVFIIYLPLIRCNLKEKSNCRRLKTKLIVVLWGFGKLNDVLNVTELASGRAGFKLVWYLSVFFPLHQLPQQYDLYWADSEVQTKWPVIQYLQPCHVYKRKKNWVQRTLNGVPWTLHIQANLQLGLKAETRVHFQCGVMLN